MVVENKETRSFKVGEAVDSLGMGVLIGVAPWGRTWKNLKLSFCAPWCPLQASMSGGTPRDKAMPHKSIHSGTAHK